MSLTVNSFFQYYIFHPIDAPREKDRWGALLTTIALGILSVGLIHIICAAAVYNRKFAQKNTPSTADKKTTQVFDDRVKGKKTKEDRIHLKPEKDKSAVEIEKIVSSGEKVDVWLDIIIDGADEGDKDFQYLLGKLYKTGDGVEQSDELAFLWFRQAAKQGHVRAQYHVAVMYHTGKGTDLDKAKAAKWYLKAAEGGDSRAQFTIGSMYHHGHGVDKNLKQAAKWYKKSALRGNDKAMNNLGVMYFNGEGVTESHEKGLSWLKKATRAGNKSSMKNLEDILESQIKKKNSDEDSI